jgi:hypothetical protein
MRPVGAELLHTDRQTDGQTGREQTDMTNSALLRMGLNTS